MGFSVSATYAVLFFAVLFAASTLYASASNAHEEITEAQTAQNEHLATIQGTDVNVTSVEVDPQATCGVTVSANNTGDTHLAVSRTDVLTDGVYAEDVADSAAVDGDADTDLWQPGEQLAVDVGGLDAAPERAKVVTGPGVADTLEVSGLAC